MYRVAHTLGWPCDLSSTRGLGALPGAVSGSSASGLATSGRPSGRLIPRARNRQVSDSAPPRQPPGGAEAPEVTSQDLQGRSDPIDALWRLFSSTKLAL